VNPGEIYRHEAFYRNSSTGVLEPKYLIVLARTLSDDVVARLLTSRSHGRPETPPCFHGNPYPSFYLGVLGDPLSAKSWVDLRKLDDLDSAIATRRQKDGVLKLVVTLDTGRLAEVMDCIAGADDTTQQQERSIRNQLAKIRSPAAGRRK
jgi:hypothetical protein